MIKRLKRYLGIVLPIFRGNDQDSVHFITPLSGDEPGLNIEEAEDTQELFLHIRKVWEELGNTEPYWSVLSSDKFRTKNFDISKDEFYETGKHNVETLFHSLDRNHIDHSRFTSCLEFGCGTGRVTRWLAEKFGKVTAYDISGSHLGIARKFLDENKIANVSLVHLPGPENIKGFQKSDIVYSVIVLQHNPPPLIARIIIELLRSLNSGGIAFFQVPTYIQGYKFQLKEYLLDEGLKNRIEMHMIEQRIVFETIRQENCRIIEVLEDNWAGQNTGCRSNTFIVQKE